MFRSGLLKTQRLQYRTLNGDNRPDYIYNGILDIHGYRANGLYGDGLNQSTTISCILTSGPNSACCGADSYGNPNSCGYYYLQPLITSSSFIARYVNEGHLTTTDGSRYFGFKQVSGGEGTSGPPVAYPCTSCIGNQATSTAYYLNNISGMGSAYVHAIKYDGTLWAWGRNFSGWLGTNNTTNYSSPVQIGTGTNWEKVLAGYGFTIALKNDGTLWSWGYNNAEGQLGDNTTNIRSSPVQIGTGTEWKDFSVGYAHTLALKKDGTLWAWGYNDSGRLGDNTTTNRSSPVQIGSGTDWKYVMVRWYSSHAIKQDDTMWAWGYNTNYTLGLGDTTNRSSPVQMGSKTWKPYITSLRFDARGAIDTDGKMWVWGNTPTGVTNIGNRISPIQVGTAVDHVFIPERGTENSPFINTSGSIQRYNSYNSDRDNIYTHFGNKGIGLYYGSAIDYNTSGGTYFMLKSGHRPL